MNSLMTWLGLDFTGNWVIYACLAAATVGGAMMGWNIGRAPLQVQLAQQATAHATEKTRLAEHAAQTLQAAQVRGDALSVSLLQQQTKIYQLKADKRYAINQATTGQPCLNGPALRLLNGAPGLRVRDLPPATGSAVAAGESSGAAGSNRTWYSSDTQVASWMVDAGAAFEVCRTRLDALIDWQTSMLTHARISRRLCRPMPYRLILQTKPSPRAWKQF